MGCPILGRPFLCHFGRLPLNVRLFMNLDIRPMDAKDLPLDFPEGVKISRIRKASQSGL